MPVWRAFLLLYGGGPSLPRLKLDIYAENPWLAAGNGDAVASRSSSSSSSRAPGPGADGTSTSASHGGDGSIAGTHGGRSGQRSAPAATEPVSATSPSTSGTGPLTSQHGSAVDASVSGPVTRSSRSRREDPVVVPNGPSPMDVDDSHQSS